MARKKQKINKGLKPSQIKAGHIYRIKDKKRIKSIPKDDYLAFNDYDNDSIYCHFENVVSKNLVTIKVTDFSKLKITFSKHG